MRKLSLGLFSVALAACGSDAQKTSDAAVVVIDAKPIDAPKVFLDAPAPTYDFSCLGHTAPATAADPVTLAGTTETLSGTTLVNLEAVQVQTFKAGNATAVDTKTSDANGAFTTGSITTGAVPLDGYLVATKTAYRTTYLYPPNKVAANLAGVPVPLISNATFTMYNAALNQNDTNNGLLFVTVSDCTLMPIAGATLIVKQNGTTVGTQLDVGSIIPQLEGVFLVSNVPDGDTTVSATYNSMTFASHVVAAHKKPSADAEGTVTATAIVPGYF